MDFVTAVKTLDRTPTFELENKIASGSTQITEHTVRYTL
jgi:hypothetical protein